VATRSPDPAGTPTFSDSWVLLAVAYAGGKRGADLASLIGVADYINHAVLTYDETTGQSRGVSLRGVRKLYARDPPVVRERVGVWNYTGVRYRDRADRLIERHRARRARERMKRGLAVR
jgi:hypothetical protein